MTMTSKDSGISQFLSVSSSGLTRGPRVTGSAGGDFVVPIAPGRVCFLNQLDLPVANPVLDVLFSLNGQPWIVVLLEVHQSVNAIFLRKAGDDVALVFMDPTNEVVRNAGVERAIA